MCTEKVEFLVVCSFELYISATEINVGWVLQSSENFLSNEHKNVFIWSKNGWEKWVQILPFLWKKKKNVTIKLVSHIYQADHVWCAPHMHTKILSQSVKSYFWSLINCHPDMTINITNSPEGFYFKHNWYKWDHPFTSRSSRHRAGLIKENLSCCYFMGSVPLRYGSVLINRWKSKVPKRNFRLSGISA